MAGLADARAVAAGGVDSGGRSDLAAVGFESEERSLFPAADRVLDHPRNNSHHFFALDTEFALAGRDAGYRRHGDGVGAGVRDGAARQLFRFVVPAGDHRREHSVFAEHRVHDCGKLFGDPRRDDGTGVCGENSADVCERFHERGAAVLVSRQRVWISGDRVFGELAGAVAAEEGTRARGEAGRAWRSCRSSPKTSFTRCAAA